MPSWITSSRSASPSSRGGRTWGASGSRGRPTRRPPARRSNRATVRRSVPARRGRRRSAGGRAVQASSWSVCGNSASRRPLAVSRTRIAFGLRTWRTTRLRADPEVGVDSPPSGGENDQSTSPVSPSMASSSRSPRLAEHAAADDPEVVEAARGRPAALLRRGLGLGERVRTPPGRARGRRGRIRQSIAPSSRPERDDPALGGGDDLVGEVADPDRLAPQVGRPGGGPVAGSTGRRVGPWARKIRPASGDGGTPSAASGRTGRPSGRAPSAGPAAPAGSAPTGRRSSGRTGRGPAARRPGRRASPRCRARSQAHVGEPGEGLGVGVAGRDPEPLRFVGAGQAPEGPGADRCRSTRRRPAAACRRGRRRAGRSAALVELAQREQGVGHDQRGRVAPADLLEQARVLLRPPPVEQGAGLAVEVVVDGAAVLAEDRRQPVGDQEVGADRAVAVLGGDVQEPEPLVGQDALERRRPRRRVARARAGPRPGQAGPASRSRSDRAAAAAASKRPAASVPVLRPPRPCGRASSAGGTGGRGPRRPGARRRSSRRGAPRGPRCSSDSRASSSLAGRLGRLGQPVIVRRPGRGPGDLVAVALDQAAVLAEDDQRVGLGDDQVAVADGEVPARRLERLLELDRRARAGARSPGRGRGSRSGSASRSGRRPGCPGRTLRRPAAVGPGVEQLAGLDVERAARGRRWRPGAPWRPPAGGRA